MMDLLQGLSIKARNFRTEMADGLRAEMVATFSQLEASQCVQLGNLFKASKLP